ncbi:MAG: CBS domain-containing protein [Pelovirga sp.]
MKTVKEILADKGREVVTIHQDETLQEALNLLVEAGIGALVVVDDDGDIAGIFSERDYIRTVVRKKSSALKLPIRDIMTSMVLYVRPDQSVDECMSLVTEKRCRHLPVLDGGSLGGLVSIGDLVKASISEKEFLIQQLTHYIKSG